LLPISLSLSRSRTVAELPACQQAPARVLARRRPAATPWCCWCHCEWPLLDYLPKAAIAGALIVVSIEMIDEKSVPLWRAGSGRDQARSTLAPPYGFALARAWRCWWRWARSQGADSVGRLGVAIACSLAGLLRRRHAHRPARSSAVACIF
jgi:hypothetical protein